MTLFIILFFALTRLQCDLRDCLCFIDLNSRQYYEVQLYSAIFIAELLSLQRLINTPLIWLYSFEFNFLKLLQLDCLESTTYSRCWKSDPLIMEQLSYFFSQKPNNVLGIKCLSFWVKFAHLDLYLFLFFSFSIVVDWFLEYHLITLWCELSKLETARSNPGYFVSVYCTFSGHDITFGRAWY